MANERTYPLLPCANLDQAIAFYETLGFIRTYRQIAPNPYATVVREDIQIHLFGIPGFDPAESYGSVLIVVPDVDALYHSFAAGLRATYGKLPSAGFPRITRPRKAFGTVRGFSVVDVGGNWLRVSKLGDTKSEEAESKTGLAKILDVAARLGDPHGDEAKALKALENGLKAYPHAPVLDYARALLYRAELAVRLGDPDLARSSLAAVAALKLTEQERTSIAQELAQTSELVEEEWKSK
jgi:hypothetical protein